MDKPIDEAVVHAFVDWLAKEMPPGTYISIPQWWASRIIRQVEHLTAAQQQGQAVAFDIERARTLADYVVGYARAVELKSLSSDACVALRDLHSMLHTRPMQQGGGDVVDVAERTARTLYTAWCSGQDIHSNRLPAWHELSPKRRTEWMDKVVAPDTGNAEADNMIGRLMHADPTFSDCTDAAALIRKMARTEPPSVPVGVTAAHVDTLRRVLGLLRDTAALQGREHISLGIAFTDAIDHFYRLAQQPAAVDGAWLSKARSLYDRCSVFPETKPDGMTALLELRNHVYSILATQHQEPTT